VLGHGFWMENYGGDPAILGKQIRIANTLVTVVGIVPPEFKGEAGRWTPEHLFVAAAEICLMATFVAIAENSKLTVAGYRSWARGHLEKVEGAGMRFTEIAISVVVTLNSLSDQGLAERVLAKAQKSCLIANSMVSQIRVDPTFVQKTALAA